MRFEEPFEYDEDVSPNMTPMIDVVFLLIIFFLAAAQLSVGGEDEIELPEASEARPPERIDPDSITIDIMAAPGAAVFAVSGKGYTYGELMKKIRFQIDISKASGRRVPPIILRADYRVGYKAIQELMFDCAALGVEAFDFQAAVEED